MALRSVIDSNARERSLPKARLTRLAKKHTQLGNPSLTVHSRPEFDHMGVTHTAIKKGPVELAGIRLTHGSPLSFLRLQRAHELLPGNVGTVAEVANSVRFDIPATSQRVFHAILAIRPPKYTKNGI